MKKKIKKESNPIIKKSGKKTVLIQTILFFIAIAAIYTFISLVSFDSSDPGWSQTSWHDSIHNWGGIFGAYQADFLLHFFGFIAYSIPIYILLFCLQSFCYFHSKNTNINYFTISFRLIGFVAFLLSSTGFFSLNIIDFDIIKAGGILGNIIEYEMLPFFNHIGASLILFSIAIACITLLTGLSWLRIAELIGRFAVIVSVPILNSCNKLIKLLFSKNNHNIDDKNENKDLDINQSSYVKQPENDDSKFVNNQTESIVDPIVFEEQNSGHFSLDETENRANTKIQSNEESTFDDLSQNEFSIEQSITEQEQTENTLVEPELLTDEFQEDLQKTEELSEDDDNSIQEIANQSNQKESLIHPLLQKQHQPLEKPTTPLPTLNLLANPPLKQIETDHLALKRTAESIEKTLLDFRIKVRVVGYVLGPVITRFEIELAPGVKASRISTLDRDLARSLSMPSVRVVEVIPGKPYVGIELPNKHRQTIYFRDVLDSPEFKEAKSPLTVVLGKDIAGKSIVSDLAKMPHLLVAGTTGSGKSVGVNAMILSVLFKSQPEDVRFIMIDPKMLELSIYQGIPHLLTDVVTDMKDAANALNWCVNEMEKRYRLMSALGVRNIAGYNEKIKMAEDMNRPIPDPLWQPNNSVDLNIPSLEKLPYIVVMVDEFADLIMAVGKKVEELIARLAQKARAAGIHLVLATQRPSVDVITGLIKANIPTRVAFTVSSKIDSRTILDQMGAESLLGMGDMLYLAPSSSIPIRVHGAFVRDEEVHSVVLDWKARGIPTQYIDNITTSSDDSEDSNADVNEELDPLFDQVVEFVIEKNRASISSVQRQFRIGYNRAARIVEQMEMQGIISAPSHNGNREVLAKSPSTY